MRNRLKKLSSNISLYKIVVEGGLYVLATIDFGLYGFITVFAVTLALSIIKNKWKQ